MSNFQTRLLAEVGALCRQVFNAHLLRARTKARVSEKAREDVYVLLLDFDRLNGLDPFPEEDSVDQGPLAELKAALADPEADPDDNERILLQWVRGFAPVPADEEAAAPVTTTATAQIAPINQRMLDATARLRSTIDASRVRLITSDPYDFKAYLAARNEFTLARAAYDKRLADGTITPSVAEASHVERVLTPAIDTATGAGFPGAIQDAADYMSDRIFTIA